MNGRTETVFDTQGDLSAAQLVVLAARLYDLRSGGSGSIPSLPDLSQPYLRFCDENGTLLRSYTLTDAPVYNAMTADSLFFSLSDIPEDPSLPETCVLEVGFKDYCAVRRYTGTRESYETIPGTMSQGLSGTGYRIEGTQVSKLCFFLGSTEEETLAAWQDAWWFPCRLLPVQPGPAEHQWRADLPAGPSGRVRPGSMNSSSPNPPAAAWPHG